MGNYIRQQVCFDIRNGACLSPGLAVVSFTTDDPWAIYFSFHADSDSWRISIDLLQDTFDKGCAGFAGGDLQFNISEAGKFVMRLDSEEGSAIVEFEKEAIEQLLKRALRLSTADVREAYVDESIREFRGSR